MNLFLKFKNKPLINKHRFLSILLILAILIGSYCFFGNYIFIKNADGTSKMALWLIIVLAVLSLAISVVYVIFEYLNNKHKPHPIALGIILITIILNIITVSLIISPLDVSFIDMYNEPVSFTYIFLDTDKASSIIRFCILIVVIYLLVAYMPKRFSKDLFLLVAYVFLISVIFGMIYSLINEMNTYVEFTKQILNKTFDPKLRTSSFLPNPNNWGMYLFIGLFGLIFLHSYYKKWWIILFAFPIFIFEFYSGSKTALLLSSALLIAYVVIYLIFVYKKHLIKSIIATLIVLIVLCGAFTFAWFYLGDYIRSAFESGEGTMAQRISVWNFIISLNKEGRYLWIGRGYDTSYQYLVNYHFSIVNAHSMYMEIFLQGGIVVCVFAAFVIVYILYIIIKYIKKDKYLATTYLLGMLSLLIYWVIEG